MFKKLCALIMAFAMVATMFAVGAAAADNTLKRGNYKYTINGAEFNPANKVSAGETVNVEVRVNNMYATAQYAYLYTALFDSTGKLVSVGRDTEYIYGTNSGNNNRAVLEATVTAPGDDPNAKYDIKSFLWDNVMVPCADIVTEAPAAPANVTVTATESGNVVAWDAVTNVEVLGYKVYCDDSLLADVKTTTYTDAEGSEASVYKVMAYGFNEGVMSAAAEKVVVTDYITATLDMADVYDYYQENSIKAETISFEGNDLNLYITDSTVAAYNNDFATNKTSGKFGFCIIDGQKCLGSNNIANQIIMINIPEDSPILSSATKIVRLTVYDNSTGNIAMRYYPTSGSTKTFDLKRENSGEWVTLDDHSLNDTKTVKGNYHFCLANNTKNGEIYISKIEILAPVSAE